MNALSFTILDPTTCTYRFDWLAIWDTPLDLGVLGDSIQVWDIAIRSMFRSMIEFLLLSKGFGPFLSLPVMFEKPIPPFIAA